MSQTATNATPEADTPKESVADLKAKLAKVIEIELPGEIEKLVVKIREVSTTYDTSAVKIADMVRESVRVRRTVSTL